MAAPTLAATRVPPRWRVSARAIEPARAPSVARASFAASRVARARWARSDDERSRGRGLLVAAPSSTARDRFDCETYAGEDNLWTTQELPRLLEFYPKKNPCDGLMLTRGSWSAVASADGASATLTGAMAFHNTTRGRHDVFVPEVSPRVTLLSKRLDVRDFETEVTCAPRHPGNEPAARPDGHWPAYPVPLDGSTSMEVRVVIRSRSRSNSKSKSTPDPLALLDAAWLRVSYVAYGRHGRTTHEQQVVLPLSFPDANRAPLLAGTKRETRDRGGDLRWRTIKPGLSVLCVPTHLLCHLDDPVSVIKKYVSKHARAGDVVALGETPLAVMQGRFRHPNSIVPGVVARAACVLFNRFASVATACGMQCLVDVSGALRVALAAVVAVVARVFRVRGVFYRLAGAQAKLVDDVSGTMPPYDQCVTLGPVNVQRCVDAVETRCGLPCAIVDVNDLTKIKGSFVTLGKSAGVDAAILDVALMGNPAGNDDQQTPLVLIRCDAKRRDAIVEEGREDERRRRDAAKRGGLKYVQK